MRARNQQRFDDDGIRRLPRECWGLIINRMNSYHYLEDLSLVCKEFLSITNEARRTLRIFNRETIPLFPKLIQRFSKLKSIDLARIRGKELNTLLHQIADSGLNLQELSMSPPLYDDDDDDYYYNDDEEKEKTCGFPDDLPNQLSDALRHLGSNMNCLKVFKCTGWFNFCDEYLLAIADSMPLLEELDISTNICSYGRSVTDDALETIGTTLKLRKLRRLDFSGHYNISFNCFRTYFTDLKLEKLSVVYSFLHMDSDLVWRGDIDFDFVLRNYRDLVSLKVGKISLPQCTIPVKSFALARSLQELEFCFVEVSFQLCSSIAEARLPLRKFVFSHCKIDSSNSFDALSSLFAAYPSLESLKLENNTFPFCKGHLYLDDKRMSDLSQNLRNLRYLNISGLNCSTTSLTFYTLARNCPLLQVLEMQMSFSRKQEGSSSSINNSTIDHLHGSSVKNHDHIKFLNLSWSYSLDDQLLENLTVICPNLEFLHVTDCPGLTSGSSKRKILKRWFKNMEITM
ncbi:putative F-box/LRR-repeat protein [Quillaja saponaria]|uniref:F-box/LRR-repeat protein n=1 Tax=Quillaja saponaria TaxID=32244 RepID=A0AAD7LR36_QUISA|nr:putative F-box/LRR-repeat protein [Quillaja saponaria]